MDAQVSLSQRLYDKYEREVFGRQEMLLINVALALITLISSAHAGEQKASAQTDTATPIENPRCRVRNRQYMTLLMKILQS